MKHSDVTADILNYLSDGKVHTLQEIAENVECSKTTVQRHIASLKYRYPIDNILGRGEKQGVILDKKYITNGKILSNDKLQIISKALKLLQNSDANVDKNLLFELIKDFSPVKKEGGYCEKNCL